MDNYRKGLKELKVLSKEWSIEDSKLCWKRFPGKKKSLYSECAKKAALSFHVFCEGKREIKILKKNKMNICKEIFNPEEIYKCRNTVYEEMTTQLNSLRKWIERERLNLENE